MNRILEEVCAFKGHNGHIIIKVFVKNKSCTVKTQLKKLQH